MHTKNFSFPRVSILYEIYMAKRKIFRIHNSIMRIESVLGSFCGWHCPPMFECLLTTQSNVHKFVLALKRFLSHYSFECLK